LPLQQPFGQLALVQMQCPLLQTWPVLQVPQFSVPPHLSEMVPQLTPWAAQVVGVQPQTPGVPPPPQVCGAAQQVAVL